MQALTPTRTEVDGGSNSSKKCPATGISDAGDAVQEIQHEEVVRHPRRYCRSTHSLVPQRRRKGEVNENNDAATHCEPDEHNLKEEERTGGEEAGRTRIETARRRIKSSSGPASSNGQLIRLAQGEELRDGHLQAAHEAPSRGGEREQGLEAEDQEEEA